MRFSIKTAVLGLLALAGLACTAASGADGLSLEVSANRENLYLEESLLLTVKVSGLDGDEPPDVSAIKDCDIKLLGSQSQSFTSITWVNGQQTQSGFRGRVFTYNITPRRTGRIRLGPVTVRLGQATAAADGPVISVTGIEEQDDVVIRLAASRDTVLVDESFEVTLNIYIRRLNAPNEDVERLLGSHPPHLSVPYLILEPMDGLEHTDIRALLQGMITQRESQPAFTLNNYASPRDPFDFDSMFNFNEARRSTPDRFSIPAKKTTLNGVPYWQYQVETKYVAREERTHIFGPVIFKGGIIQTVDDARQVTLRDIFAVGPSVTVRVIPPPEEGRPDSFIGAIGTNMLVDAKLDAQNCRVGDPLTLTLSVTGGINLKNIYPPNLAGQPQLQKQFRLYEDTLSVRKEPEEASFSYTLRPTEAGTLELPPIDLSYFDSASRTYRTVQTAPIPVTAAKASDIDTGAILGAGTNITSGIASGEESSLRYTAPFTFGPGASQKIRIGLGLKHIIIVVTAPAVFLVSLVLKPAVRMRRRMDKASRTKSIYRKAIHNLKHARNNPRDAAPSDIAGTILSYAGSFFGVKADSLTPPDLERLLRGSGLNEKSLTDLTRITGVYFNAAFSNTGAAGSDIASDAARAAEIITELEDLRKKSGSASPAVLALAALLSSALIAAAADSTEAEFLWQKAWSRTLSSSSPEDFARAAADYRELAASGIRNKYVFYNMGTALLLAGDNESAQRALERAELYGGSDSRTLQNLRLAAADGLDDGQGQTTWTRIVFFWHYALPLALRINIAVGAWVCMFLVLTAGRKRLSHLFRGLLLASMATLVLFGSSALTSALQEHQARIRDSYMAQQAAVTEEAE